MHQQQRNTQGPLVPAVEFTAYLAVGGTVRIYYPDKSYYQIVGRVTAMPSVFASSELQPGQVAFAPGPRIRIGMGGQREIRLAAAGVKPDTMTVMTDLLPDGWLFAGSSQGLVWSAAQPGVDTISVLDGYMVRIVGDAPSTAEVSRHQNVLSARLPAEADHASKLSVQRGRKAGLPLIRGTLRLRLKSAGTSGWFQPTLVVDGNQVATTTKISDPLMWNSTGVPDGEYVIEATASSARQGYRRIRKRMLVLNNAE